MKIKVKSIVNDLENLHFPNSSSVDQLSLFSLRCPYWFFPKLHGLYF